MRHLLALTKLNCLAALKYVGILMCTMYKCIDSS